MIRFVLVVCSMVCLAECFIHKPDCTAALCSMPYCPNPVVPTGQCCPRCPQDDCNLVDCGDPPCPFEEQYVPEGSCCGVCRPSCSAVTCVRPVCPHEDYYIPIGECCPVCSVHNKRCLHKGLEYKPGGRYVDDCNECVCKKGQMACTKKPCGVDCSLVRCAKPVCPHGVSYKPTGECCDICGEQNPTCVYKGKKYKHGESFQDDCNTCRCRDGEATCTEKACAVDCALALCATPICPSGVSYVPKGQCCAICGADCTLARCGPPVCPNNEFYTPKWQCCPVCGVDCSLGPGCATLDCPPEEVYTPNGKCCPICRGTERSCSYKGALYQHGQSFKDDCNTCRCANGSVGCTKMRCVNKRSCRHKGQVYKHDETFKDDCNTCFCSDGRVGCTLMACGPSAGSCRHNGKLYEPGQSFKDDCNSCGCFDGLVRCTKMLCGPIRY